MATMTIDDTSIRFANLSNEVFSINGPRLGEPKMIRCDSVTFIRPNKPTLIEGTGLCVTHWRFSRTWRVQHFDDDGTLLRTLYASPHLPMEIGGYGVRLQWDADGVARAYVGRCD
jgi:hypothetical protein